MGAAGGWTSPIHAHDRVRRLPGAHCYDVYAGSDGVEQIMAYLEQQHEGLEHLVSLVQKDCRDVRLVGAKLRQRTTGR